MTVTAAGPTEERTAVERWHDIPRAWRVALVVAAAVVATASFNTVMPPGSGQAKKQMPQPLQPPPKYSA